MYEPTLPRDLQDAIRAVGVDDAERAALADLLGDLASEPVPPDELTARRHIRAMCEAGGAMVESRVTSGRRRGRKVRVVAASWIAAATVLGGAGVAAATGSLPGPIQHAVAGVTHAVGIDIPGAPHRHPNPHGSDGANGGSTDHRGTRSGSGGADPATHEGTPGASVPARGSGASGVTTVTTAPSAGNAGATATTPPASSGSPATGNGASASSPGHGATPPGQGGTPPGQVTNPGQGNGNGNGNNGNGNANGQGNGASASSPGQGATPPGQGGTPPGQQKQASGA
jgi:hypothetical protein